MEYPSSHVFLGTCKPLGAYLVEAGLLTDAQVGVALADQGTTFLPFGEIVVTRGWVKEQTIEYLMQKVIMPERLTERLIDKRTYVDLEEGLVRQKVPSSPQRGTFNGSQSKSKVGPYGLREAKATTPPPQTADDEHGISWIG
jgi:hypothetical protein